MYRYDVINIKSAEIIHRCNEIDESIHKMIDLVYFHTPITKNYISNLVSRINIEGGFIKKEYLLIDRDYYNEERKNFDNIIIQDEYGYEIKLSELINNSAKKHRESNISKILH